MRGFYLIRSLLFYTMLITSCSKEDPCAVDHVIINDECMPTYIFPNTLTELNEGRYYHAYYGVISFQNGLWYDLNHQLIAELNVKKN